MDSGKLSTKCQSIQTRPFRALTGSRDFRKNHQTIETDAKCANHQTIEIDAKTIEGIRKNPQTIRCQTLPEESSDHRNRCRTESEKNPKKNPKKALLNQTLLNQALLKQALLKQALLNQALLNQALLKQALLN